MGRGAMFLLGKWHFFQKVCKKFGGFCAWYVQPLSSRSTAAGFLGCRGLIAKDRQLGKFILYVVFGEETSCFFWKHGNKAFFIWLFQFLFLILRRKCKQPFI